MHSKAAEGERPDIPSGLKPFLRGQNWSFFGVDPQLERKLRYVSYHDHFPQKSFFGGTDITLFAANFCFWGTPGVLGDLLEAL